MSGILTFGGAYSNHLVATAFACKAAGLKSVGFVRGEKPIALSPTLRSCIEYGMQLHFLTRAEYETKDSVEFLEKKLHQFKDFMIVPEGGYHPKGAAGAALICELIDEKCTHICTALGTATTMAGLLMGAKSHQQIIGIPVLKGMTDINERINYLTNSHHTFELIDGYHFGGYAKKTTELISFMNKLYQQYNLPTDFVYTGKMMLGIFDAVEKGYFPPGANIMCVHTGGLQGNVSLSLGTLIF
jgi:1-aminocyclopropane-1-carboxylate deaminase/D-cysteine desulfhydrase-like pyridoxal-dependent ACC family enzyme